LGLIFQPRPENISPIIIFNKILLISTYTKEDFVIIKVDIIIFGKAEKNEETDLGGFLSLIILFNDSTGTRGGIFATGTSEGCG
jgi:hypothetical protein